MRFAALYFFARRRTGEKDPAIGMSEQATSLTEPKQRRYRANPQQKKVLLSVFATTPRPDESHIKDLSTSLQVSEKYLRAWFQNRRTRLRVKAPRAERRFSACSDCPDTDDTYSNFTTPVGTPDLEFAGITPQQGFPFQVDTLARFGIHLGNQSFSYPEVRIGGAEFAVNDYQFIDQYCGPSLEHDLDNFFDSLI